MKARLTDRVRLVDGEVTTLAALIERGEVTFHVSERFSTSGRGKARRAYFADHVSGYSVEMTKTDYDYCTALRVFPAGGSSVGNKNLSLGQSLIAERSDAVT